MGVDYGSSVLTLYEHYLEIVSGHQEKANNDYQVGGEKVECEADEVCFRVRAGKTNTNEDCLEWQRIFGIGTRGSAKVVLHKMDDKLTGGAGQGGGGAISVDELQRIMRLDTDHPLLLPRSVLHTDSAKSYKRLGPLQWPEASKALHAGEAFATEFAKYEYVHTTVTHKRKVGEKGPQYKKWRTIRHFDGTEAEVLSGTQTLDGFWRSLKNGTARRGFKSGAPGSRERKRLWKVIREFQWRWWWLEQDRFKLFCHLVRERR